MASDNKGNRLEWICRILMTIDVIVIISGYLSYFQTRHQLVSPLIPKSAIYEIMSDSHVMEASVISAILFLGGLWFYFFQKTLVAIAFFAGAILAFKIVALIY